MSIAHPTACEEDVYRLETQGRRNLPQSTALPGEPRLLSVAFLLSSGNWGNESLALVCEEGYTASFI